MADDTTPLVTNLEEAPEESMIRGQWGHHWKVLTPAMRERGGKLGVTRNRVPPGCASVPFHWHTHEDEVFFVLSGRGVLRYGEHVREIGPGDCISCPAGTRIAHQICNPFEADLEYLAIGPYEPHEVCGYPDTGKVLIRSLQTVGTLEKQPYMHGEPDVPAIFGLID